jgi:hypothetical protein
MAKNKYREMFIRANKNIQNKNIQHKNLLDKNILNKIIENKNKSNKNLENKNVSNQNKINKEKSIPIQTQEIQETVEKDIGRDFFLIPDKKKILSEKEKSLARERIISSRRIRSRGLFLTRHIMIKSLFEYFYKQVRLSKYKGIGSNKVGVILEDAIQATTIKTMLSFILNIKKQIKKIKAHNKLVENTSINYKKLAANIAERTDLVKNLVNDSLDYRNSIFLVFFSKLYNFSLIQKNKISIVEIIKLILFEKTLIEKNAVFSRLFFKKEFFFSFKRTPGYYRLMRFYSRLARKRKSTIKK